MTDLIRLAEMVEGLAGPDRDVDAAIGQATVGEGWRVDNDGSAFCWVDDPEYGEGWMLNGEVPHYTSSIDAAMTLVPEGMRWTVSNVRQKRSAGSAPPEYNGWAGVYGPPMIGSECDSFAATPALALAAAALRAIEAHRGQG